MAKSRSFTASAACSASSSRPVFGSDFRRSAVAFQASICLSIAALTAGSAAPAAVTAISSAAVVTWVMRMFLAWKNAHRSDDSTFLLIASVCAPLPAVSEKDRNNARIAITSATRLLKPSPCSPSCAFSIASWISDMVSAPCVALVNRRIAQILRARVGGAISADQAFGVDFGINLRGGQRGVAEQFLDRADVAAAGEQVRGEGMPQRVRRCGLRQAERAAQPRHGELDEARRQRPALGADEQRPVVGQVEGTERDVIRDQLVDLRQQRHHALLAALSGDSQRVARAEIGALQAQRFGNAQAAAIEQRQHRG